MKGLFVVHTNDQIYGASKSIAQLLNHAYFDFDLVIAKSLSGKVSEAEVRRFYGPRLVNLYYEWLPYKRVFLGYKNYRLTPGRWIKFTLKQGLSKLNLRKLQHLFSKPDYDFIYLNSITLYPLITDKHNFFIHVRENLDCTPKQKDAITTKLKMAKGVVFIDASTVAPFADLIDHKVVLNNPFGMKEVPLAVRDALAQKYKINPLNTVFSIVGNVSESKGIDRVIRSFIQAQPINATLLIIGSNDSAYGKSCVDLAKPHSTIHFTGEVKDASELYSMTDIVLRGEDFFAIGRSVYEGLYSGCHVMMAGSNEDINKIFEAEKFEDKVHFYQPHDPNSLTNMIKQWSGLKLTQRQYTSNVNEYVKNHEAFLMKCLNEKAQ